MSGILFVHGGDSFARHVYVHERRGYWSAALPLALEKYGYLDIEVRGPGVLDDPTIWQQYDIVLLARMPAGALSPETVSRMRAAETPVLVEAPLPSALHDALGVKGTKAAKPTLVVMPVDEDLSTEAERFGYPAGGRVIAAFDKEVAREPEVEWRALPDVPLDESQAAAWRAPGWDAQIVSLRDGTQVLAEWWRKGDGPRYPAVLRRHNIVGCTFGLFAAIGQAHTAVPATPRAWPSSTRITGLETMLLALVDRLYAAAGVLRPRVLPWPGDATWAMGVRHDYDRLLSDKQVATALGRHHEAGTHATWYWRSRHVEEPKRRMRLHRSTLPSEANVAVRRVADTPGHEVALHTEQIWRREFDERGRLERALGRPIRGASAHGDPTCFRFQGAPNVLWAEVQGLDYTELIQHAHFHPHRFAALGADGRVEMLRVLCLPHHESFDAGMRPGQTYAERILQVPEQWRRVGGYLQVMNHPDIHGDEFFQTLQALDSRYRIDLNASEAIDWWRTTHTFGSIAFGRSASGAVIVFSAQRIAGVGIELRAPDGTTSRHIVNLDPENPVTLAR